MQRGAIDLIKKVPFPIKTNSTAVWSRFPAHLRFVLPILIFCAVRTNADAVTDFWINSSLGNWFIASNWQGTVPDANATAVIANGGTALINAPSAQTSLLQIGRPLTTGASTGTLLITGSGALTAGGNIGVGESVTPGVVGQGTLTIGSGGTLTQNTGGTIYLADGSQGSTGSITVTDAGSSLTAPVLLIGEDTGHATMTVQNGGTVHNVNALIAYSSTGASPNSSTGSVTVTGANSAWAITSNPAAPFRVGSSGTGSLTVSSAGSVAAFATEIAALSGSSGTVTVTGSGSSLTTDNLDIGGHYDPNGITPQGDKGTSENGGAGTLQIQSGGLVTAANLKLFSNSLLSVDNGSSLTAGLMVSGNTTPLADGGTLGDMVIGNTTGGRMEIHNHGKVFCNRGYLGLSSGSNGSALVIDYLSEWQATGSIWVGNSGDGTLDVYNGGHVNTWGNIYIGYGANTSGVATISGQNSVCYVAASVYVGGTSIGPAGTGLLRVDDNGFIQATSFMVYDTGGLAIGVNAFLAGPNSSYNPPLTIQGGFVEFVADATFYNNFTIGSEGVRTYTYGHTAEFYGNLTGSGGLTKGGGGVLGFGTLTLSGASNYTGATAVTAGTLLVNGSITSPVTVSSGATLGGSGAVGAVTVNSGGIVAPGNSPGKLTVNGNYVQTSGATLKIELGGATAGSGFDQIAATGIASLGGVLDVSLVNGFRPKIGDTFQIITSNGETGNFSTVSSSSGLTVRADVSSTGVVLTVIGIDPLLRIISIARNGNDILVTYDATGGKTYRLERKAALTDPMWLPITGVNDQTPLANGPATFTDPGAVSLGKAFYRVSVLPAPGVNLLVNGNAEAGSFSATGAAIAVPGWTTSSAFTVVNYKPAGDTSGFPKTTDAGPSDRANQFFAGGNASISTATQTINVSANAADIDNGHAVVDLSGWLGGDVTDGDNAALKVEFFNGTTNLGGSGTIGPVTNVDRGNITSLLLRSQTIAVPPNTRQLLVTLTMNRNAGAFNDGYADSLSVVLRVP